jgi:Ca-activated chloride channel family protein
MQHQILSDRPSLIPDRKNRRQVVFRLTAPKGNNVRLPLEVSIVCDTSGSMEGAKIEFARRGARKLAHLLNPVDSVSLVEFHEDVYLRVPQSMATADHIARLDHAIAKLRTSGSTNLFDGWATGCEQLGSPTGRTVRRVILLTDGLANRGLTDQEEIGERVRLANERLEVQTSVLGIGERYDEDLLTEITRAGRGNLAHASTPAEIDAFFEAETRELLEVVARRILVKIELPTGAKCKLVSEFAHKQEGPFVQIEVGDILAEQSIDIVMELKMPALPQGDKVRIGFDVAGQIVSSDTPFDAKDELVYTCEPDGDLSRAPALTFLFAQAKFAQKVRKAMKLNGKGEYAEAVRTMEKFVARLERLSVHEPRLLEIRERAQRFAMRLKRRMNENERKAEYSYSVNYLRQRRSGDTFTSRS